MKDLADAMAHNAKFAGGNRMISYDETEVLAPLDDIQNAITMLSEMSRTRRRKAMGSVKRAIDRAMPSVKDCTASEQTAMDCMQDIVLWFANEIVEGRETLAVN